MDNHAKKKKRDLSFEQIREQVINGDNELLKAQVIALIEEGINAGDILYKAMIPAMDHVGDQFKKNEIFIPEVLLSARALNDGLQILEPYLTSGESPNSFRVLIGTIQGDMHDIGKNLVAIMLKGAGFDILDLGFNVPNKDYLTQAALYKPDLICLSSLLTTAMPEMKSVIDGLEKTGLRKKIKVMVGGAPVNQRFADNIGADGYADDAVRAVDVARKLLNIEK
ncbi:corrinoid protein [bacterium]|nr:corrinoid protein [bacterium]